jgi:hypothetical protein
VNDDELRALVRQAIQRHMSLPQDPGPKTQDPRPRTQDLGLSFSQYALQRAADDTACLIEPAVACNHCGFCKCHGH